MTSGDNLHFIINNVEGIKISVKRLKWIKNFQSEIVIHDTLLLPETHFISKDEQK